MKQPSREVSPKKFSVPTLSIPVVPNSSLSSQPLSQNVLGNIASMQQQQRIHHHQHKEQLNNTATAKVKTQIPHMPHSPTNSSFSRFIIPQLLEGGGSIHLTQQLAAARWIDWTYTLYIFYPLIPPLPSLSPHTLTIGLQQNKQKGWEKNIIACWMKNCTLFLFI